MGKILEYIQQSGKGKYQCYKTKKLSLDTNDNDTIAYNYDDKTVVQTTKSVFAETERSRQGTIPLHSLLNKNTPPPPIFRYFLDGSRHTYKVDDIAIGKKIFPIVAGQIIVGCCERKDRDTFKKNDIRSKIVIAMPDDFDDDDGGENFCRSYCEKLNEEIAKIPFIKERGIKIEKLLLYKTDGNTGDKDKDNYKNRAVAQIQAEMTDEEQLLVAELCRQNKLDDESWLIKDGSLEYNPGYSNLDSTQWNNLRANYQNVVGVSKMFDPELLPDYEGSSLAKTIANLKPFERTKVYRYETKHSHKGGGTFSSFYAVWYLRLRNSEFRETSFSDIVKCEMVLLQEDKPIHTDIINVISANLIREAYPVCFGADTRWANHLYPVFLTESFCKSHYIDNNVILNLF
ncbi:MAG: hypothetical protein FWC34_01415 [Bacteroidetes bacterium]|nr:hypothetical protein [Bacteroidota bacterium]MCL2302185.1 hypothetical protein [Lentimicrobiaceae bacterium]